MPLRSDSTKVIDAASLEASGKLAPAQGVGGKKKPRKKAVCSECGVAIDECECADDDDGDDDETGWSEPTGVVSIHKETEPTEEAGGGDFGFYVPLLKANVEARTVTGVVLVPEEVDAQGDVYDAEVIRKAAYEFLSTFNVDTTLGMMHKNMDPPFTLCESYCAPCQLMIGIKTVKEGTWIITVKINDDNIWALVKGGKITGFSIGGVAKVKKIETVK